MKALTDLQRTLLWCVLGLALVLLAAWHITARIDGAIEAARTAGYSAGQLAERATWEGLEQERAHAVALVKEQDTADREAERQRQIAINLKVSQDHEKELDELRHQRDADRLAFDRAGGLRIRTAEMCAGRGNAPPSSEAPGAGGRDEASTSTVRLPLEVENDLWRIVNDADEVSGQLRACQGWILDNGFYGPETSKTSNNTGLLDRMISVPNQPPEDAAP